GKGTEPTGKGTEPTGKGTEPTGKGTEPTGKGNEEHGDTSRTEEQQVHDEARDSELNADGYPEGTRGKADETATKIEEGKTPSKDGLRDTEANARGKAELEKMLQDPKLTPEERARIQKELADKLKSETDPTGNLERDLKETTTKVESETKPGETKPGETKPGETGKTEPTAKEGPQSSRERAKLPPEQQKVYDKAWEFYKSQGMPDARIEGHLRGIDFSKPVEVTTLPKGTVVQQTQPPGAPQGSYYAPPGTEPGKLGISPKGDLRGPDGETVMGHVDKQTKLYVTTEDVVVLRSSAAKIEDTWSMHEIGSSSKTGDPVPFLAEGGGTQYFTNSKVKLQPYEAPSTTPHEPTGGAGGHEVTPGETGKTVEVKPGEPTGKTSEPTGKTTEPTGKTTEPTGKTTEPKPGETTPGEKTPEAPKPEAGLKDSALTDRFAGEMKGLEGKWPSMSPQERANAIREVINGHLRDAGVPELKVKTAALGEGTNGHLDFRDWAITLNEGKLNAPTIDSAKLGELSNTVYHEARHGEQWYLMARHMAEGGMTPHDISVRTGIPEPVCDVAASEPKMSPKQAADAQKYYDSVYGTNSGQRNQVLNDLKTNPGKVNQAAAEYNAIKDDPRVSFAEKKAKYDAWVDAYNKMQQNYQAYRNLPEEADAWATGDAAEKAFQSAPKPDPKVDPSSVKTQPLDTSKTTTEPTGKTGPEAGKTGDPAKTDPMKLPEEAPMMKDPSEDPSLKPPGGEGEQSPKTEPDNTQRLKELADAINDLKADNAKRNEVLETLRTPNDGTPGPLEGHVLDTALEENKAAIRQMVQSFQDNPPDVIVGMKRGGAFLTDVLGKADPALLGKVREMDVHKATGDAAKKGKFDQDAMTGEFEKLITDGAKKIAIVDTYMGGRTASSLRDQIMKPLAEKYPDVKFEVHWVREMMGLPDSALRGTVRPGQKGGNQISTTEHQVRMAIGDDMTMVYEPSATKPVTIFDKNGQIVKTFSPAEGQTSRDVIIDLLTGRLTP
ncbi:MAG TPA: polymorphic toxin type 46 domain-containing protein, partial [Kofleriaceae bacterium]|nr:polymorphic toxin type 46 domain-containing protein [Kofleriaceae bacterium]